MKKYLLTTFLTLFLISPVTVYADYHSEVRCDAESYLIDFNGKINGKITGRGNGKTREEAKQAAIRDAKLHSPSGTYVNYCHEIYNYGY